MNEELINFNTAKLAKEKGFNEPCMYGYFDLEEGHMLNGHLEDFTDAYTAGLPKQTNKESDVKITAPTQSLLQKWLREIHKIDIEIEVFSDEVYKDDSYYDYMLISNLYKEEILNPQRFDTYELALEAALLEVLKDLK